MLVAGKHLPVLYEYEGCASNSFFSGAAYGRAEKEIRKFVLKNNLPFLPTPMGKGVIPDDHPLCVAAARSRCATEGLSKTLYSTIVNMYNRIQSLSSDHVEVEMDELQLLFRAPEKQTSSLIRYT